MKHRIEAVCALSFAGRFTANSHSRYCTIVLPLCNTETEKVRMKLACELNRTTVLTFALSNAAVTVHDVCGSQFFITFAFIKLTRSGDLRLKAGESSLKRHFPSLAPPKPVSIGGNTDIPLLPF